MEQLRLEMGRTECLFQPFWRGCRRRAVVRCASVRGLAFIWTSTPGDWPPMGNCHEQDRAHIREKLRKRTCLLCSFVPPSGTPSGPAPRP